MPFTANTQRALQRVIHFSFTKYNKVWVHRGQRMIDNGCEELCRKLYEELKRMLFIKKGKKKRQEKLHIK